MIAARSRTTTAIPGDVQAQRPDCFRVRKRSVCAAPSGTRRRRAPRVESSPELSWTPARLQTVAGANFTAHQRQGKAKRAEPLHAASALTTNPLSNDAVVISTIRRWEPRKYQHTNYRLSGQPETVCVMRAYRKYFQFAVPMASSGQIHITAKHLTVD